MIFRSPHPPVNIPSVSLGELILSRAESFGDKPALIDGLTGRSYTFSEFVASVRGIAGSLAELGFKKGDVMALMCHNCPEYGMVFLATALLGGINTTLNPTSTSMELDSQASDSGARYLFTTPEVLDRSVRGAAREWKQTIVLGDVSGTISFENLLESRTAAPLTPINPAEDIVALPYSSGTTGIGKGVKLTHQNIVANLRQIATGVFTETDVIAGLPPFFHIYGLTVVLHLGLYLGATDVIFPRFEMNSFLDSVERYGITHINLVPPLILALKNHAALDPKRLSSLKTVQSGAAPLSPDTAREFAIRFDCHIRQGYGLTETSPVTHLSPRASHDVPIESIGPPVSNTECLIRDLETGGELGINQSGELYVRGPQVMQGYLNDPEKTERMIDSEGWLRTGDIAYADEQGNFYVVDRVKELIKYKGYAIAPAELEVILLSHPLVRDAAVVPIPDDQTGQIPKAFVVAEQSLGAAELMSWVAGRVAPHKKIRTIEFVEEIPRSASGKILRRVLMEREP
jgi:acyl-CoA synthetase (AMP-forming)/AMP-acid ligase II